MGFKTSATALEADLTVEFVDENDVFLIETGFLASSNFLVNLTGCICFVSLVD